MKHRTRSGCCEKKIGSSKAHIPQRCQHGELFFYTKQLGRTATTKRRSSLKRTQRRESAAEKRARLHFNETVLDRRPCFFRGRRPCEHCRGDGEIVELGFELGGCAGPSEIEEREGCLACSGNGEHHCSGRKDAHHLVEKQFIRRNYADLPEDKLLAILFDPRIGAPLCRTAHDGIKANKIFWHELTDECKEFCAEVDDLYLHLPTPAGARRQSMSVRLKQECPESPDVRTSETTQAAVAAGCPEERSI